MWNTDRASTCLVLQLGIPVFAQLLRTKTNMQHPDPCGKGCQSGFAGERACPAQAETALLQADRRALMCRAPLPWAPMCRAPLPWALTCRVPVQNCYIGAEKSMLIPNTLFRVGGAAVILTNRITERRRAKYELQHVVRIHMGHNDMAYE